MWCILDTLATTAAAAVRQWARMKSVSMAVIDVRVKIQQIMRTEWMRVSAMCVRGNALIMIHADVWNISLSLRLSLSLFSFLPLEMCTNQIFELRMCAGNWQHTHTCVLCCTSKRWENERCGAIRWSMCALHTQSTGVNLNYVLWMHKYTHLLHINNHICSIKRAQVVAKWCHWLEYAYCLIAHIPHFCWGVSLFCLLWVCGKE